MVTVSISSDPEQESQNKKVYRNFHDQNDAKNFSEKDESARTHHQHRLRELSLKKLKKTWVDNEEKKTRSETKKEVQKQEVLADT